MTANMQKVLLGLGVVVVAALLWIVLITPARDDLTAAESARSAAETQAAAVAGQLATAKAAAARAPENEETLKRLGVAVPEKVEAPALIDGLDSTAKRYDVSFDVLKVSNGAATATTAPPAAAGTPAGVAADGSAVAGTPPAPTAPAGSVPVELNVEIAGRYTSVTKFLKSIQAEVRVRDGKRVSARGRLLRVQSVDLAASDQGGGRNLKGTLSVVAYLLPKDTPAVATAATTTPGATTPGTTTPGTATAPATTGSQP